MTRRLVRTALTCLATSAVAAVALAAGNAAATRDPARQVINLDNSTVVIYEDGHVYRRVDMGYWYMYTPPATTAGLQGAPRMAPPPPPGAFEWAVLSDEALDELMQRVEELGLDEAGIDFGSPMITDSPTSLLELSIDGEVVSHSVYAPDFDDGLTPEEQQHRAAYNEMRRMLFELDDEFGDQLSDFEPYVPSEWHISFGWRNEDPPREWPLDTPPVSDECVALPSDPDVDTATGAYLSGNEIVYADAVLPRDPRCA